MIPTFMLTSLSSTCMSLGKPVQLVVDTCSRAPEPGCYEIVALLGAPGGGIGSVVAVGFVARLGSAAGHPKFWHALIL
eukprot:6406345-Pyramimonas_sp.AAC.1